MFKHVKNRSYHIEPRASLAYFLYVSASFFPFFYFNFFITRGGRQAGGRLAGCSTFVYFPLVNKKGAPLPEPGKLANCRDVIFNRFLFDRSSVGSATAAAACRLLQPTRKDRGGIVCGLFSSSFPSLRNLRTYKTAGRAVEQDYMAHCVCVQCSLTFIGNNKK